MEDGLVLLKLFFLSQVVSLNPCCSGRWSRTVKLQPIRINNTSLNPCCSGRWSRTALRIAAKFNLEAVLILVVVEDGLVHRMSVESLKSLSCLNPCCSGRWSRTVLTAMQ